MSVERFKADSAEQLADDLTNFLYARDRSFATAATDVSSHAVRREARVDTDDDGDDILIPTVTEKFEVVGYRNIFVPGRKQAMPSDFVVTHRRTTFINEIPAHLRHVLDSELIDQYDRTEPGDLNEVHGVVYGITVDHDGLVSVGRDISYQLRDLKEAIYKVRESKLPKTKKVYVPTEDDYIRVRIAALPDTIEDIALQVQVGVDFCMYTLDEIANMEQNWLEVELLDQIACINAIMNSLVTGRPVAKIA